MTKTYIQLIRELREDNDLLQKNIAKILGTSQKMYSRYETGETELPIRHLIKLSQFYKVSTDYILGLKHIK